MFGDPSRPCSAMPHANIAPSLSKNTLCSCPAAPATMKSPDSPGMSCGEKYHKSFSSSSLGNPSFPPLFEPNPNTFVLLSPGRRVITKPWPLERSPPAMSAMTFPGKGRCVGVSCSIRASGSSGSVLFASDSARCPEHPPSQFPKERVFPPFVCMRTKFTPALISTILSSSRFGA